MPAMKKEKIPVALIIATLSVVANVGLGIMFLTKPSTPATSQPVSATPDPSLSDSSNYPLLAKRIFSENQNDLILNFIPLRQALKEYVGKQEGKVGAYFEYLPSGTSIGVNDELKINLASLIKIPIVMGAYLQMEKGEIKKDDKLTIKKEDFDKRFGDIWQRGEGATLTVEEAIRFALINSDNTSAAILRKTLPHATIDNVFDSLDIPKDTQGKYHIISPKNYTSILRSLYLSSYLTKASSNEILDVLTETVFNDKLVAGVPKGTKVAHKIGVFSSKDSPDETYSDCGIIYVPDRPYSLCIFVRGTNEEAQRHMATISKMVYGYVIAVKGGN